MEHFADFFVEDFQNFYPIRFIDKSKIYKIKDLKDDENLEVQLKGRISELKEIGVGKVKRLSAKFGIQDRKKNGRPHGAAR